MEWGDDSSISHFSAMTRRPAPSSGEEPRIATPSSGVDEDGVENDATVQHERAVKFDFHTGASGTTTRGGSSPSKTH